MTMHFIGLISTPTLGKHGLTINYIFDIARFGVSNFYECSVRIYVLGKDPKWGCSRNKGLKQNKTQISKTNPFKVITQPEGLVKLFFQKQMVVIHLKEERIPYLWVPQN
jgi:hypothetical protein